MLAMCTSGRKKARFPCMLLAALLSVNSFAAQEGKTGKPDVYELISEVYSLVLNDEYDKALFKAEECLRVAEKNSGPEHPDISGCLNAKALIFASQEQYTQAEALYLRAVAIDEKASGSDSVEVADDLDGLASIYEAQSQYEKAMNHYERVLQIREKALGKEDPEVAETLYNIALILVVQSRYQQAESLLARALAIREKTLGPEHKDVAEVLDAFAGAYEKQGKFDKAKPLQQRASKIIEKALGDNPLEIAAGAATRARMYQEKALYAQAEPLWQKALEKKIEAFGPEDDLALKAMADLAGFYSQTLQFSRAQSQYEKILAIRETRYGKEHASVATTLGNLALMFDKQGRYVNAEQLYLRAIGIIENANGNHAGLLPALNGLGLLYLHQGRLDQAKPILERALVIAEKSLPDGHPKLAISLYNLASVLQEQKQFAKAESLLLRAVKMAEQAVIDSRPNMGLAMTDLYVEQTDFAQANPLLQFTLSTDQNQLGRDHPLTASFLKSLASLYVTQARYAEAEPLFRRAVEIFEKPLGPANPGIASVLGEWSKLHVGQTHYAEAETMQLKALGIMENALGQDHPMLAPYLYDITELYLAQGRLDAAQTTSQRVSALLRDRYANDDNDGRSGGKLSEQKSRRNIFLQRLYLLSLARSDKTVSSWAAAEAFEFAQLARASSVGQSIGQMAARFAQGGDELAQTIREQQDAQAKLRQANQALLLTVSQSSEQAHRELANVMREDVNKLNQRLDELERKLVGQFPQYRSLISQTPVSAKEVQGLLAPDEALIVYTLAESRVYAWVVTPDKIAFLPLATQQSDIDQQVRFLRSKLQPDAQDRLPAFTPVTSQRLYQAIFAPLEPHLSGVKHILQVNEGALQGLPFALLGRQYGPMPKPTWLAERFSFSVLPSVSALKALRVFTRGKPGDKPFVGFGDPVLSDAIESEAEITPKLVFRSGNFTTGASQNANAIADVEAIRKAVSLPQTAAELLAISAVLKGADEDVYLRERATETHVRSMDLMPYRFLAFATHGVVAGEMPGLAEPGLILTPPGVGTAIDDGYLASGEIAQLKLNADWVLLSACNTAASDGSSNAEGLSGLAKAFFYAGSRSLLVSNWPVASNATRDLMTRTVGLYASSPGIRKSDALKQASAEMATSTDYAHPFYWAAFSVVGD